MEKIKRLANKATSWIVQKRPGIKETIKRSLLKRISKMLSRTKR